MNQDFKDKIIDRYTPSEFVELIEIEMEELLDCVEDSLTCEQIGIIKEDMRFNGEDEDADI